MIHMTRKSNINLQLFYSNNLSFFIIKSNFVTFVTRHFCHFKVFHIKGVKKSQVK